MKAITLALLATAVALNSAMPWFANSAEKKGYFDAEGYYHKAVVAKTSKHGHNVAQTQAQAGLNSCISSKYSPGSPVISTFLHICESEGDLGLLISMNVPHIIYPLCFIQVLSTVY